MLQLKKVPSTNNIPNCIDKWGENVFMFYTEEDFFDHNRQYFKGGFVYINFDIEMNNKTFCAVYLNNGKLIFGYPHDKEDNYIIETGKFNDPNRPDEKINKVDINFISPVIRIGKSHI